MHATMAWFVLYRNKKQTKNNMENLCREKLLNRDLGGQDKLQKLSQGD